jgi:hypothetical protein
VNDALRVHIAYGRMKLPKDDTRYILREMAHGRDAIKQFTALQFILSTGTKQNQAK